MGNIASVISSGMKKTMDENMEKQQEFMVASQKANMERQMTMQQLMQQKQMAMQLARSRDLFHWSAAFSGTVSLILMAGSLRMKNPKLLAPLLPLSFVAGYQYDMVYGDKMKRIRTDAENILQNHKEIVSFPNGPVTFVDVENELKELKK